MKHTTTTFIALGLLLASSAHAQIGGMASDAAKQLGGSAAGAVGSAAGTATGAAAAPAVAPSNGLTDVLMQQLGVTQPQATGGAGAIFGLAKSNMATDDFSKVAAGVPGMDSLLAAAPSTGAAGGLTGGLAGMGGGSLGSLAGLAGSFSGLGMTPDMATKFVPVCLEYVKGTAGPDTASLLQAALQ